MSKGNIIKLRQLTGAGLVACQEALEESGSDLDKAIEILRKKGALKAAKKIAERTANEGLVGCYLHANGKIGAMVQVNCESDFVANTEEFKELVHDLAMQIAATEPLYLKSADVPAEELNKEKEIYAEQLKNEGKPEAIIDKIVAGKLEKYYQEVCLLNQAFIKDDKVTIKDLVDQKIAKVGEKIEIVKFARFAI